MKAIWLNFAHGHCAFVFQHFIKGKSAEVFFFENFFQTYFCYSTLVTFNKVYTLQRVNICVSEIDIPHCLNVVSVRAAINLLENCTPVSSPTKIKCGGIS